MLFWEVNWLWSVLPIPLALLLATRLRARDWLLERNTIRAWFWPVLAIIVPLACILTAVPLYRIYQIPDVGPGFSPEQYDRPVTAAERATMDLYRQAIEALHPLWPSPKTYELRMGTELVRSPLPKSPPSMAISGRLPWGCGPAAASSSGR